jgi:hypothetical protein
MPAASLSKILYTFFTIPYLIVFNLTIKAIAVPLHATKALGGEEAELLLILDLGIRWG